MFVVGFFFFLFGNSFVLFIIFFNCLYCFCHTQRSSNKSSFIKFRDVGIPHPSIPWRKVSVMVRSSCWPLTAYSVPSTGLSTSCSSSYRLMCNSRNYCHVLTVTEQIRALTPRYKFKVASLWPQDPFSVSCEYLKHRKNRSSRPGFQTLQTTWQ